MGRLKDKIALVTGAASGIGTAIAQKFSQEGAHVIATDINPEGKKILSNLQGLFLTLDVREEDQWQSVLNQTIDTYGRLDILVNNAGITGAQKELIPQDPEHASLENWRKVHAINLDGVFLGCKYGIQVMKHGKTGSIINISSRSGLVGVPGLAAYASSKAAVHNHTKSVALFCASQNYTIRCNSIAPASILTPLWDELLTQDSTHKKALDDMAQSIPLKRLGMPEDVAYAALFLASEESSYMTGSELILDGGILAGSSTSPIPQNEPS